MKPIDFFTSTVLDFVVCCPAQLNDQFIADNVELFGRRPDFRRELSTVAVMNHWMVTDDKSVLDNAHHTAPELIGDAGGRVAAVMVYRLFAQQKRRQLLLCVPAEFALEMEALSRLEALPDEVPAGISGGGPCT